jgi:hypothetical protein
MEYKAGNLCHARDFYSRAWTCLTAELFRLTTLPEDLREQLEINVTADRTNPDSEPGHSFQEDWTPPAARPLNVGRNDPCPCGSGRSTEVLPWEESACRATAAPDLPKR